jgi:hypothetical protein
MCIWAKTEPINSDNGLKLETEGKIPIQKNKGPQEKTAVAWANFGSPKQLLQQP